jgi:hypothetical protein
MALDPAVTRHLSRRIKHAIHRNPKTALLDAEATKRLTERFRDTVTLNSAESAAMGKLTPKQQKQYEAVAAKLDNAGRANLERLLVEGKLPGAMDKVGEGNLLDSLSKLATQELGAGINRSEVLSQTLQAVADPSSITQGAALTCGAATVQIMLAKESPAEYARLMAGLAGADGKVKLAGGKELVREAGWNASQIPGAANQLMQTAFMEYATGNYDSVNDLRADGKKGLYVDEVAFLQEGVLGRAVTEVEGNSDDVMLKISGQANSGKPVSVLVEGEGGGHYVQVTKVKDGKLTYIDPRDGQEHTVDAAEFQKQVRAANIDAPKGTKLRKARPKNHKGILGGGCFLVDAIKAVVKAVVSVVKAVVKAVVSVVKAVAKAVVAVVKAIAAAVKAIVKFVIDVVKKVWEVVKSIAKGLAWLWDKIGNYVIMALQIVCLFIPGCQAISLALAAYQLAKGAYAVGKGIVTGDWKEALGGVVSMVGAFAGGVGALGAKVVGQGLATGAQIAGRIAQAAHGAMGAAEAIRTGNWGGLVASVAGAAAGAAGAVSETAGKVADKLAGWANKANGLYQGIKNGDAFQIAASATDVAASGGKLVAGKNTATDVLSGVATGATVVNTGQKVAKAVGTGGSIALGITAGAGALATGIGLAATDAQGRENFFNGVKDAATSFGEGNYDKAGRNAARALGISPNSSGADVLAGITKFAGGAVDIVKGVTGANDLQNKAGGQLAISHQEVVNNNQNFGSGIQNTLGAFGVDAGVPPKPQHAG